MISTTSMQARSSLSGTPVIDLLLCSVADRQRRYGPVVALDRVTDPAARAVQQDALVPGRDVERITDLLRAPALDVPQRDHGPLCDGQVGDRGGDDLAGLTGQQALVGRRPSR